MTIPLPDVEPVERLMIVVGLRSLISREVERFRKSELAEFDDMAKEIQGLARKLVHNDLAPGSGSAFNYRSLLKDLAAGWDEQQVLDMIESFPGNMRVHASAVLVKTRALIDTLQTKYPQTNYVTATGSTSLVPADRKVFKFVQVLEVLCDPLSVFSLMADGSLLQTQVQAVHLVYPTLSTAIDAALLEATTSAKAAKKSFELTPRAEVGVRAWFGKGPVDTGSLKKAQDAVERSNQKQQASAMPSAGTDSSKQTTAQKTESRA